MDFGPYKEVSIPADSNELQENDRATDNFRVRGINNYSYPTIDVSFAHEIYQDRCKVQNTLQMLEIKAEFAEAERERQKAQVDMLQIDANGVLLMQTINTRKKYFPRQISNLTNPQLNILFTKDKNDKIYEISFRLGNRAEKIYIKDSDVGNGKILLKKINAKGGEFFENTQNKKINAAIQLLATLLQTASHKEIPYDAGWYENTVNQLEFHGKEEMTWKRLEKII